MSDEVNIPAVPQSNWAAPKKTKACHGCGKNFGFFATKRNCHCCGNVCCSDCLKLTATIPPMYTVPKPVCLKCFTSIGEKKKNAAARAAAMKQQSAGGGRVPERAVFGGTLASPQRQQYQRQIGGVVFNDNYNSSDVSRGGCRITCTASRHFTQLTKDSFPASEELAVTCKVYKNESKPIAFGLVPENPDADQCVTSMLGQSAIPGSVGVHILRNEVHLLKNSDDFFTGACDTGNPTAIQLVLKNGKLSVAIDGKNVNSKKLSEMTFRGRYHLGVSMMEEDQVAEVYYTCPLKFKDCWSAGHTSSDMLAVRQTTDFTMYSEEVLQPSGVYSVTANVLKSEGGTVGLGILPEDSHLECRNKLVGCFSGSAGFLFKSGTLVVYINDKVVFAGEADTRNPSAITMTFDSGTLSFKFDGKNLDCDELKTLKFRNKMRVGVGLSTQGQVVEMRGGGIGGGTLPLGASSPSKASKSSDSTSEADLLAALLAALGGSDGAGHLRWKDNMRSIKCDNQDHVAVCVRDFSATLFTQRVVSASSSDRSSIQIRILACPSGKRMFVGIIDEDHEDHEKHHVGSASLKNSLGMSNNGNLFLRGDLIGRGLPFKAGDVVEVALHNGSLTFRVNNQDASDCLHRYGLNSKFRWAVSFMAEGQAVKIGEGALDGDERTFCREKGVFNPVDSVARSSTPPPGPTGDAPKCRKGHSANYAENRPTGWVCDTCLTDFRAHSKGSYRCHPCDFDMCKACWDRLQPKSGTTQPSATSATASTTPAFVPLPADEAAMEKMSMKDIRAVLAAHNIKNDNFCEKAEFIAAVMAHKRKIAPAGSSSMPGSTTGGPSATNSNTPPSVSHVDPTVTTPVPLPADEAAMEKMSMKDIRAVLAAHNIKNDNFCEKAEFIAAVMAHKRKTQGGAATTTTTTTTTTASTTKTAPVFTGPVSTHPEADEGVGSAPPSRIFKRCRVAPDAATALTWLLTYREVPKSRPDLSAFVPDQDDLNQVLSDLESFLPQVKARPEVQDLIQSCQLSDDDITMLVAIKIEAPYPVYRWLNGFLASNRRDNTMVQAVGPAFTMLHRAMEKLPKKVVKASRGVLVNDIPALKRTFDGYEQRLAPGSPLNFWGSSSFTMSDAVLNSNTFIGTNAEDAIVYTCPQLTGVDMEPFSPPMMDSEEEVLPMCPSVFKVIATLKVGQRVIVTLEQVHGRDSCYVGPK